MTNAQKDTILALRAEGLQYQQIADRLGVSVGSIKMMFYRLNNPRKHCKYCDRVLPLDAPKKKEFCSDKCRIYWWRKTQRTKQTGQSESLQPSI